jgi:lysophospholipase L1-like esterase
MDGWKNEEGKRNNHSSNSQWPITNAQCFSAQFPIRKTNRARTARPIYQQLANNYFLAELNFNHAILFRFRFRQSQV